MSDIFSATAPALPDHMRARFEEADLNLEYLEDNDDLEFDLSIPSEERDNQVTNTSLVTDPLWIDAARALIPLFGDKPRAAPPVRKDQSYLGEATQEFYRREAEEMKTGDEMSDEEVAQWGLELMGHFNWNLSRGTVPMALQIQDAPLNQRIAMYALMKKYDDLPEFTWDGSKRALKGLVGDISTYLGLGTLGGGLIARWAAKEAGKKGAMAFLRSQLPAMVLGGIEGGAFTSIDDAARQAVSIAAVEQSGQDEFDLSRNLVSASIGTAVGTALPPVVTGLVEAARRSAPYVKNTFNQMVTNAMRGDTFTVGVDPTNTGNVTRSTGAQRGARETIRSQLSADDRGKIEEVSRTSGLSSAAIEAEYRRLRENYPVSKGWSPITLIGADEKNGKIELKIQEQAYAFHKSDPDKLSSKMVDEIVSLQKRVEAGDPVAKEIWEHRSWYSEMRQRLRAEFGSFGDVVADVLGTTSAQTNVRQNFENTIEVMHRFSRGDYDLALDILQTWLDSGLPLGSGKSDGDGYVDHHYKIRDEAFNDAKKFMKGQFSDEKELDAAAKQYAFEIAQEQFPLIAKNTGKLFNANSPATMMALLNLFREAKQGGSPKTPNFTGNLIGFSDRATIDVWAARNLRRLAGLQRIPPKAEKGVGGDIAKDLVPGGEFGFGQDVYRRTTTKLREQGIDLNDDDLQAVVWFLEKEHWTKNGWTTRSGEGGSLEAEADLAGRADREELKAALNVVETDSTLAQRTALETDLADPKAIENYEAAIARKEELGEFIAAKTPAKQRDYIMATEGIETREAAMKMVKERRAEISALNREIKKRENLQPRLDRLNENRQTAVEEARPVVERGSPARRLIGSLSIHEGDKVPTDAQQSEAQTRLLETGRPDESIIMLKATPTVGRYIDPEGGVWDERSIDFEYVAREDHDPADMVRQLVQEAKDNNQESAFFSEVVKPGTVEGANPGMEIYFNRSLSRQEVDALTKIINQAEIDVGFTFATDLRAAERFAGGTETGSYVGLRMQYIPEFGGGAEGADAARKRMFGFIEKVTENDYVSTAQYNEYDTQGWFRDIGDYDAELAGSFTGSRRPAWRGQQGSQDAPRAAAGADASGETVRGGQSPDDELEAVVEGLINQIGGSEPPVN